MANQDLSDDSYKKLILTKMTKRCFPLENDVVSRFAQSCTLLQHLELGDIPNLKEGARMSLACLFREIIQNDPPLIHLNL